MLSADYDAMFIGRSLHKTYTDGLNTNEISTRSVPCGVSFVTGVTYPHRFRVDRVTSAIMPGILGIVGWRIANIFDIYLRNHIHSSNRLEYVSGLVKARILSKIVYLKVVQEEYIVYFHPCATPDIRA